MAVPKQRKTKGRRDQRRMHLFIKKATLTLCPKCAKPTLPHRACSNCGYYRGREVLDVLKKLTKKEKKERGLEAKEEKTENKPLNPLDLSKK